MPNNRTKGEIVNTWLQSTALIIAAIWAGYTFYYEKIKAPKAAPINISLKLDLKKLDKEKKTENLSLIPIGMNVSATNPSSRTVYILSSAWVAYGRKIKPVSYTNNTSLCNRAVSMLNSKSTDFTSRHTKPKSSSVVATGNLFTDHSLKPNETITRTLVFYVPENEYDSLAVTTVIPTNTSDKPDIGIEWLLVKPQQPSTTDYVLVPKLFRLKANNQREELNKINGRYVDIGSEFQMPVSMYVLGL